jgi:hypothetical protein
MIHGRRSITLFRWGARHPPTSRFYPPNRNAGSSLPTAEEGRHGGVSKPSVWRWQKRLCARASLDCRATRPESPACRHCCRRRWSTVWSRCLGHPPGEASHASSGPARASCCRSTPRAPPDPLHRPSHHRASTGSGRRRRPANSSFPRKRESRACASSLALDPRLRGGDEWGGRRRSNGQYSRPRDPLTAVRPARGPCRGRGRCWLRPRHPVANPASPRARRPRLRSR